MRASLSIDELEFDIEIPNSLQWNESLAEKIVKQISEVFDAVEAELEIDQIEIDSLEIDLGIINSLEDIKNQLFYQLISHLKNPRHLEQISRKSKEVKLFDLTKRNWKEAFLSLSSNENESIIISSWVENNEINWDDWLSLFKELSINIESLDSFIEWIHNKWRTGSQKLLIKWLANILKFEYDNLFDTNEFFKSLDDIIIEHYNSAFLTNENSFFIHQWLENYLQRDINGEKTPYLGTYKMEDWVDLKFNLFENHEIPDPNEDLIQIIRKHLNINIVESNLHPGIILLISSIRILNLPSSPYLNDILFDENKTKNIDELLKQISPEFKKILGSRYSILNQRQIDVFMNGLFELILNESEVINQEKWQEQIEQLLYRFNIKNELLSIKLINGRYSTNFPREGLNKQNWKKWFSEVQNKIAQSTSDDLKNIFNQEWEVISNWFEFYFSHNTNPIEWHILAPLYLRKLNDVIHRINTLPIWEIHIDFAQKEKYKKPENTEQWESAYLNVVKNLLDINDSIENLIKEENTALIREWKNWIRSIIEKDWQEGLQKRGILNSLLLIKAKLLFELRQDYTSNENWTLLTLKQGTQQLWTLVINWMSHVFWSSSSKKHQIFSKWEELKTSQHIQTPPIKWFSSYRLIITLITELNKHIPSKQASSQDWNNWFASQKNVQLLSIILELLSEKSSVSIFDFDSSNAFNSENDISELSQILFEKVNETTTDLIPIIHQTYTDNAVSDIAVTAKHWDLEPSVKEWESLLLLPLLRKIFNYLKLVANAEYRIVDGLNYYHLFIKKDRKLKLEKWLNEIIILEPSQYSLRMLAAWIDVLSYSVELSSEFYTELLDEKIPQESFSRNVSKINLQLLELQNTLKSAQQTLNDEATQQDDIKHLLSTLLVSNSTQNNNYLPSIENWSSVKIPLNIITESTYSWRFYSAEILENIELETINKEANIITNWINKITIPGSNNAAIWAKINTIDFLIESFNKKATYQWEYTLENNSKIVQWINNSIDSQTAILFLHQIKITLAQTNKPTTKIKWIELLIITLRSINSQLSFSTLNNFVTFIKTIISLDTMELEFLNISLSDILQVRQIDSSDTKSEQGTSEKWLENIPDLDYFFLKRIFLDNPEIHEKDWERSLNIASGEDAFQEFNYKSIFFSRLHLEFIKETADIKSNSLWYKWVIHTLSLYFNKIETHYSWKHSRYGQKEILNKIWSIRSPELIIDLSKTVEIQHPLFNEFHRWKEDLFTKNLQTAAEAETTDSEGIIQSILNIKIPTSLINRSDILNFLSEQIDEKTTELAEVKYKSNQNKQKLIDQALNKLISIVSLSNGSDSIWKKFESWITTISIIFIKGTETTLFYSGTGIRKSDWFTLLSGKWNFNNSKPIIDKLISVTEISEFKKLLQLQSIDIYNDLSDEIVSSELNNQIDKVWSISDYSEIKNASIDEIIEEVFKETSSVTKDTLQDIKNRWFAELLTILNRNYITDYDWKRIKHWVLFFSVQIIKEQTEEFKFGDHKISSTNWFELLGTRLNHTFIETIYENINTVNEQLFLTQIYEKAKIRADIRNKIKSKFRFTKPTENIQKTEWLLYSVENELQNELMNEIEYPSIIRVIEWQNFELIEALETIEQKIQFTYDELIKNINFEINDEDQLLLIWQNNLFLKTLVLDPDSTINRRSKPIQKVGALFDLFTALFSVLVVETKIELSAEHKFKQKLILELLRNHITTDLESEFDIDFNVLKQNWTNTIVEIRKFLNKQTNNNLDNRIPFLLLFQELLTPTESLTALGIELIINDKSTKWKELAEIVTEKIEISESPWLGSELDKIIDILGFENTVILESIILQTQYVYPHLEKTFARWFDEIIEQSTQIKSKDVVHELLIPELLKILDSLGLNTQSSNKNMVSILGIFEFQSRTNLSISWAELLNQQNTISKSSDIEKSQKTVVSLSELGNLNKIEELFIQSIFNKRDFQKTVLETESLIAQIQESIIDNRHWIRNAIINSLEIDQINLPKIEIELDITSNSFQTNQTIKDEFERGTRFTSKCAGIILLAPFYATLFRRMKLLEKNEFIDVNTQLIAYQALLEILKTDEILPVEIQDLVIRIITGIQPELEISQVPSLSKEQQEEIKNFITAVKSQWTQVNGMSLRGFIETYLHRSGTVWRESAAKWQIKIDGHGSDILLQTLPWGFATMKFPWTPYMVTTEWEVP